MNTLFSPLQLLSVALAGWMNRYQQAVIDYLVAENQLLKGCSSQTDLSRGAFPRKHGDIVWIRDIGSVGSR